jgi:Fe-S-cluster containining protein
MGEPRVESPRDLAAAWLAAARDEHIAAELEAVYECTAAAVESRGPACWASGRCCNFDAAGHRLYVTGLEAAYTVLHQRRDREEASVLTVESLAAARARGGCHFQSSNLCSAHAIKPLGCRVYFCDRSAQAWQHALSERALDMIRSIHDRHRLDYRYGEWRDMLAMFLE